MQSDALSTALLWLDVSRYGWCGKVQKKGKINRRLKTNRNLDTTGRQLVTVWKHKMEILPYCFCCCIRGISDSVRTCFLPNRRNTKECRKEERNNQNKRLRKQELLQNRRKQERLQNQRRHLDVYSLSQIYDKDDKRMIEFNKHNLAKTHNFKKFTANSDSSDTSNDVEQKHHRRRIKSVENNRDHDYDEDNKHQVQLGSHKLKDTNYGRQFDDDHMGDHRDDKNKAKNEMIRSDPNKMVAKLKHHDSHTHIEHKVEQTTIHTVITKKEKKHISHDEDFPGFKPNEMKNVISKFANQREQKQSLSLTHHRDNQNKGASQVRAILKQDNNISNGEMKRKEIYNVREKQKKHCQEKRDAKNSNQSKLKKNLRSVPKGNK